MRGVFVWEVLARGVSAGGRRPLGPGCCQTRSPLLLPLVLLLLPFSTSADPQGICVADRTRGKNKMLRPPFPEAAGGGNTPVFAKITLRRQPQKNLKTLPRTAAEALRCCVKGGGLAARLKTKSNVYFATPKSPPAHTITDDNIEEPSPPGS